MAIMFRPVPVEQEPKKKNRFVLEFPSELGIDSFLVQTSGKPSIEIGNVEIPYMNSRSPCPGSRAVESCGAFLAVRGIRPRLALQGVTPGLTLSPTRFGDVVDAFRLIGEQDGISDLESSVPDAASSRVSRRLLLRGDKNQVSPREQNPHQLFRLLLCWSPDGDDGPK